MEQLVHDEIRQRRAADCQASSSSVVASLTRVHAAGGQVSSSLLDDSRLSSPDSGIQCVEGSPSEIVAFAEDVNLKNRTELAVYTSFNVAETASTEALKDGNMQNKNTNILHNESETETEAKFLGYDFESDNFNSQVKLDLVKRKVCNQNKECTQAQEHRSRGRPKGSRDTSKRIRRTNKQLNKVKLIKSVKNCDATKNQSHDKKMPARQKKNRQVISNMKSVKHSRHKTKNISFQATCEAQNRILTNRNFPTKQKKLISNVRDNESVQLSPQLKTCVNPDSNVLLKNSISSVVLPSLQQSSSINKLCKAKNASVVGPSFQCDDNKSISFASLQSEASFFGKPSFLLLRNSIVKNYPSFESSARGNIITSQNSNNILPNICMEKNSTKLLQSESASKVKNTNGKLKRLTRNKNKTIIDPVFLSQLEVLEAALRSTHLGRNENSSNINKSGIKNPFLSLHHNKHFSPLSKRLRKELSLAQMIRNQKCSLQTREKFTSARKKRSLLAAALSECLPSDDSCLPPNKRHRLLHIESPRKEQLISLSSQIDKVQDESIQFHEKKRLSRRQISLLATKKKCEL